MKPELRELIGAHPELIVHRNPLEGMPAESEQHHRLVHRRMRLRGAVHAQSPGRAERVRPETER